jgi:hypothetical protein
MFALDAKLLYRETPPLEEAMTSARDPSGHDRSRSYDDSSQVACPREDLFHYIAINWN